jgi:hypothetical protein
VDEEEEPPWEDIPEKWQEHGALPLKFNHPVDWDLLNDGWHGGQPPKGHPRQCQGVVRWSGGRQCPNWAIKTRNFCKRHGGHNPTHHSVANRSNLYSRHASQQLKDVLERVASTPDERQSLADEIDVSRAMCERAIRLFEQACLSDQAKDYSIEIKTRSVEMVQTSLEAVSKLIQAHTKLMVMSDRMLTTEQIEYMFVQLNKTLTNQLLPDHPEIFERITEVISNIRLPEKSGSVVNITIQ